MSDRGIWRDGMQTRLFQVVYGGHVDPEVAAQPRRRRDLSLLRLAKLQRCNYAVRVKIEGGAATILYTHRGVSLAAQAMEQQEAFAALVKSTASKGVVVSLAADKEVYRVLLDDKGQYLAEEVAPPEELAALPQGYSKYILGAGLTVAAAKGSKPLPAEAGITLNPWSEQHTAKSLARLKLRTSVFRPGCLAALVLALLILALGVMWQQNKRQQSSDSASRQAALTAQQIAASRERPPVKVLKFVSQVYADARHQGLLLDHATTMAMDPRVITISGTWSGPPPVYAPAFQPLVAAAEYTLTPGQWSLVIPLDVVPVDSPPQQGRDTTLKQLADIASEMFATLTISTLSNSGMIGLTLTAQNVTPAWLEILGEKMTKLPGEIVSLACDLLDSPDAACEIKMETSHAL